MAPIPASPPPPLPPVLLSLVRHLRLPRTTQVTGNKVGVPWRPAKRQNQELFRQKVGFWADGAAGEEGAGGGDEGDGDTAATALDREVRGTLVVHGMG